MKSSIRKFLAARGLEIVQCSGSVSFLHSRAVDLVIDIGANEGQYALGLGRDGYSGRIESFEPSTSAFPRLNSRASGLWVAHKLGAGNSPGAVEINISKNTVFNSIKPSTILATTFDANAKIMGTEVIEIVRIDEFFNADSAKRVFVKIDTQGFELEVLDGLQGILERCVGIQLELPIEHLYENVWSFREALEYMEKLGFTPAQIRPVNSRKDDGPSALEFDCVFRRI